MASEQEYIQSLYIARDSIYATLRLLEIFFRQRWISYKTFLEFELTAFEINCMFQGLIAQSLKVSKPDIFESIIFLSPFTYEQSSMSFDL